MMSPARFVTACFLYSGTILLIQAAIGLRDGSAIGAIVLAGTGLAIVATGILRLRDPELEADNPATYGPLAYGIAALSLMLTVLVSVHILVL